MHLKWFLPMIIPAGQELYERLDREKHPGVTVVHDNSGFEALLANLREKQANGKKISLGLSGGGAWGMITFRLAKALFDKGIKPTELVGNSVGAIIATLLAQGYTDEKYIDFFFYGLNGAKDLNQEYLYSKLIPFTVSLSDAHRNLLIEDNTAFRKFLKDNLKTLDSTALNIVLNKFFESKGKELLNGDMRGNIEGKKISLNDIAKETGIYLWIQASVVAPRLTSKKYPIPKPTKPESPSLAATMLVWPGSSGGFHDSSRKEEREKYEKELARWENNKEQWEKSRGNKNNKLLRPITLRGSIPVIDALIASASPTGIGNTSIKWRTFKTTDGYWSGQWYAHKSADFREVDSTKVVIQTDDNYWVTRGLSSNYETKMTVVRPDVREGWAFDFSNPAKERFAKITADILDGNK